MKKLLLIDAYAWIYRSYYAVRPLSSSKGVPTNAVLAMMRFLLKLEDEFPGCDGAFVFDLGKSALRIELAPDYKANRPPMPDDMKPQIPLIRELIHAFGWPFVEYEGYEADDLIAGLVRAFPEPEIRIVSGDKDLSQLIDARVEMLTPSKDGRDLVVRGEKETLEKFGVPPSAIADYLALVGDTSDNIPGIEGVGPKTAAKLLTEFGSIDAMLDAPERIEKESLRKKIVDGAERLALNRKLVRLPDAMPSGLSLGNEALRKNEPDYETICASARELELRSLARELEKRRAEAEKNNAASQGPVQLELF